MSVAAAPPLLHAQGAACGKVILVGEHAVVHGCPALAAPLRAVNATVRVLPVAGPLQIETDQAGVDTQGLAQVAHATLARCGREAGGLTLRIQSNIPPQAGLGSSAATAIAVVRAVAAACDIALPPDALVELADIGEQAAHGRASGVDVAACLAEGAVRFVRGEPSVPVPLKSPVWLIVGDSGTPRNTRNAVAAVSGQPDPLRTRAFDVIAEATSQLELALREGNLDSAGAALNLAHTALSSLGVSTPALNALCQAATHAGALGAKLTGAGCGGCVVALSADEAGAQRVQTALRKAGAVTTFAERLTP